MVTNAEVIRGLRGVYFDTTTASYIDGDVGKLVYRGYDIADLAEHSTVEETSYLLLEGKLPTRAELDAFDAELKESRSVPEDVIQVIRLVQNTHPMDVLRTAVSALAASDPDVNDNSAKATIHKGTRLTAQAPTIVAAHHRIRQGLDPVPPSATLSHAENFLYMLFNQEPDAEDAKLMDTDFILHAEHGSNASAFAARVVAGTAADLHGAVTAGIATLKGPLHGGAAEAVMKMATEIGTESQAEEYVRGILENGGRVMGFGHRVYRVEDPRARHLRDGCQRLGEKKGEPEWFRILSRVAEVMQPYQDRGIYVNVDFWAGAIYQLMGIPEDLFISIFALGRIPGWTLQVVEQFNNNILIRPLLKYVGPMDLEYIPIEKRG
jgi:citrate synthase